MSFPDHVDNILTYVEREYLRGRSFTKFQKFNLCISRMLPCCKKIFIGKVNDCFEFYHYKVNNIPFELEIYKLGTTCEIWEKDLHLDIPNPKFQGIYSVQYDDFKDDSCPAQILTSEYKFQVCGIKLHTATTCYQFSK